MTVQVEAPEAVPHLQHPGGDGALVADVHGEAENTEAQVGGSACGPLLGPAREGHARTGVDERPGHRQPEAAGGAGDQRTRATQVGHAVRSLPRAGDSATLGGLLGALRHAR